MPWPVTEFQPGTASSTTGDYSEVWRQVSRLTPTNIDSAKSLEAVMLMETFDRLSRKEKYVWDVSVQILHV